MTGYTKLFSSILMSSIWEESTETRLVWVTLLALADQHGHVDGTVRSLARVSRVSLKDCQKALECLLGPDADDRSGNLDGRRVVTEQGGWRLVNYAAYRAQMSAEERRERDRLRKRNQRVSARSPHLSENVRDFQQAEAEAEAEADPKAEAEKKNTPPPTASARGGGLVLSPAAYENLMRNHAYVGARLKVPNKLHRDFIALLGGQDTDARLRAWYADVDAEIEVSGEAIVPDVWKFLERRFKAWATTQATDAQWAAFDAKYGKGA